jgi:hypothetical protein
MVFFTSRAIRYRIKIYSQRGLETLCVQLKIAEYSFVAQQKDGKRYHHHRRKTLSQDSHMREHPNPKREARSENSETGDHQQLLLHRIHLIIELSLLLQRGILSHFLLLALTLDFLRDEILVGLKTALDVNFEFDNIIEHALELGVEFFADCSGAES